MGTPLFGIDISGIVASQIGPALPEATLTIYTLGQKNPQSLSAGVDRQPVIKKCRGVWEDFTPSQIGPNVLLTDRKALLIGDTIPADAMLKKGDLIEIDGQTLMFWRWLSRDPAGATMTAHCRDQRGQDGV